MDDQRYSLMFSFGPFSLAPFKRLLSAGDEVVRIGDRPLDILIALVERQGELVSKKELFERVWGEVVVDESTLRFSVGELRKVLAKVDPETRYIATVSGRGYCFVAPVSELAAIHPTPHVEPVATHNFPPKLDRLVGRTQTVDTIVDQMIAARFVSIVGPGGMGKTTVAISAAHQLVDAFDRAVFVDFSQINAANLVPNAIASLLGILTSPSDPLASIAAYLADKRMLLVLDSCEHVIDVAAALAERIFIEAPAMGVLVTSREVLRVEGEFVHRLEPLATPQEGHGLTLEHARDYPAVDLFLDRMQASGVGTTISDAEAELVASICRRLDGIALAIELAASRVAAYGLTGIADLLDNRFRHTFRGRRTAPARQQTLNATLDWSYDLLGGAEQRLLSRLSLFVGSFSFESVSAVMQDCDFEEDAILDILASLVAKSLLAAIPVNGRVEYRLLDTMRSYLKDKLAEAGEFVDAARRHAEHVRDLVHARDAWSRSINPTDDASGDLNLLGNAQAALGWALQDEGDPALGIALAAATTPLLLETSQLTECKRWSDLGLRQLTPEGLGAHAEMHLRTALGQATMFTKGNVEDVRLALTRALEISDQVEARGHKLRVLGTLHLYHERIGDFLNAHRYAVESEVVAAEMGEPEAITAAHSLLGVSNHLHGDHAVAKAHLVAALSSSPSDKSVSPISFGFNHRNRSSVALARTLWLQGFPDQAATTARRAIDDASELNHPVTLCFALIWAISISFWTGNLDQAEEWIQLFSAHAQKHSLGPYIAVGVGAAGELSIRRGDPEKGIADVRACMETLRRTRYELLTTVFDAAIVDGMRALGQAELAHKLASEAVLRIERNGDHFYLPEMIRLRACSLSESGPARADDAMRDWEEALNLATMQGAGSWRLRIAISMANQLLALSRRHEAGAIVSSILSDFTEGFDTEDLKTAMQLVGLAAAA